MNPLKFFNILLRKSSKSYYDLVVITSRVVDFLKITTAVVNCKKSTTLEAITTTLEAIITRKQLSCYVQFLYFSKKYLQGNGP